MGEPEARQEVLYVFRKNIKTDAEIWERVAELILSCSLWEVRPADSYCRSGMKIDKSRSFFVKQILHSCW